MSDNVFMCPDAFGFLSELSRQRDLDTFKTLNQFFSWFEVNVICILHDIKHVCGK